MYTGKTAKIESKNTFVCERAERAERLLELLIVLQLEMSISLQ